jgi:organic radical activating enzyme
MKLNNIFTSLGTEFPNKISLVISVSGCNGSCENCHSQDLKNWDIGENWKDHKHDIAYKINSGLYDSIVIIGGDIIDNFILNKKSTKEFITFLFKIIKEKHILFYTRYELKDEILKEFRKFISLVNTKSYYIKTGAYIEKKKDSSYWLGSTNQKIYKIIKMDLEEEQKYD